MQRYDLVGDYDLSMVPISDGDYVLYSTAIAAIAAEREACAAACEEDMVNNRDDPLANYFDGGLAHCAGKIRMRSNVEETNKLFKGD